MTIHRVFLGVTFLATRAWLRPVSRGNRHFTVGGGRLRQSGPRSERILLVRKSHSPKSSSHAQHIELSIRAGISNPVLVTLNGSRIQLAVGPQPLWLRNHNSGLAHWITLVVVSVHYGPFNPYIPIRSTTIGKSRVAIDLIAMHTSWRSNSDIASVTRSCSRYHRYGFRILNHWDHRHVGQLRQSGPRPDPRLLRQTALEVLTRSERSDSPRRVGRKQISGDNGAATAAARGGDGGGGVRVRREAACAFSLGLGFVECVLNEVN
ncbi:sister chromatid arm cohesin [Dorcoceras hygrometricum]|uniref:Sister chromatid arm cohesin n=1 Tax=Dorcoceras hygrometricum TaxID=472368 RepID=A0A2Z7CLV0_9LAMI|nr:sister chromatid arm cohesin [Dorcoceras hygrometricum]